MPPVSVRLLRLSLASLLAGALAGAWLLAAEPWASPWLGPVRDGHVHLMLFGWLAPFVIGTAYWILPRHASGAERGPPGLAGAGYWLLVAGLVLGAGGAFMGLRPVRLAGVASSCLGIAVFVPLLWPRVRPFGAGTARARSEVTR